MKKKNWMKFLSAVLFISFSVYSVVFAGDKTVKFDSLPKVAQDFYTLNFGKSKIKKVEYDRLERRYEIELWNETSLTFTQKGEWLEVDCDKGSTVPQSVIDALPTAIKEKIMKDYSTNLILEIKRNLHNLNDIKYSIEFVDGNGNSKEVKLN